MTCKMSFLFLICYSREKKTRLIITPFYKINWEKKAKAFLERNGSLDRSYSYELYLHESGRSRSIFFASRRFSRFVAGRHRLPLPRMSFPKLRVSHPAALPSRSFWPCLLFVCVYCVPPLVRQEKRVVQCRILRKGCSQCAVGCCADVWGRGRLGR